MAATRRQKEKLQGERKGRDSTPILPPAYRHLDSRPLASRTERGYICCFKPPTSRSFIPAALGNYGHNSASQSHSYQSLGSICFLNRHTKTQTVRFWLSIYIWNICHWDQNRPSCASNMMLHSSNIPSLHLFPNISDVPDIYQIKHCDSAHTGNLRGPISGVRE